VTEFDWDTAYSDADLNDTPVDEHLIEFATDLSPGTALDLGCGAGQNVRWLVARGWDVTGVDISVKAIDLAHRGGLARRGDLADRGASERGQPARFLAADIRDWKPDGVFDLVISTYALPSGAAKHTVLATAAESVAPGGTLLVTEFSKDQHDAPWLSQDDVIELDDVLQHLDDFSIDVSLETDSAHVHGRHSQMMRVVVVKARRRGQADA